MPPKPAMRRQPRRGVRAEPGSDPNDAPLDTEDAVGGEPDLHSLSLGAEPRDTSSSNPPDGEQSARPHKTPLGRTTSSKRTRATLETPPTSDAMPETASRRPPTSDPTSESAARPTSAARPMFRYQPKAAVLRMSKEEREAKEEEILQQRLANEALNRAGVPRTRGRPSTVKAGRGGLRAQEGHGASGPLGHPSASSSDKPPANRRGRGGRAGGGGGGSGSTPKDAPQRLKSTSTIIKKEPDTTALPTTLPRKPRLKSRKSTDGEGADDAQLNTHTSSDDEFGLSERMDIEHINLDTDDESDDNPIVVRIRGSSRKLPIKPRRALRPVYVERQEHVQRAVGVNTDASVAMSSDLRQSDKDQKAEGDEVTKKRTTSSSHNDKSKDVEFVRGTRKWKGVYDDDPEDEPRVKEEPEEGIVLDSPTEVDPATKVIEKGVDENGDPMDQSAGKRKTRRRKKVTFRDPKDFLSTEEDRQEWARYEVDTRLLRRELMNSSVATDDQEEGLQVEPTDRLVLMQFPPLTPMLIDKSRPAPRGFEDPEATPIPIPGAPRPADSKKITIKAEEEEETKPKMITAVNPQLPSGYVGKLRLHKSGKVTLDWGGTSLEVSRGTDVSFLQNAIVIPKEGADQERLGKTAWSVAQVTGKLIVTPDWEEILS